MTYMKTRKAGTAARRAMDGEMGEGSMTHASLPSFVFWRPSGTFNFFVTVAPFRVKSRPTIATIAIGTAKLPRKSRICGQS
jgi:hypothetical protein